MPFFSSMIFFSSAAVVTWCDFLSPSELLDRFSDCEFSTLLLFESTTEVLVFLFISL